LQHSQPIKQYVNLSTQEVGEIYTNHEKLCQTMSGIKTNEKLLEKK